MSAGDGCRVDIVQQSKPLSYVPRTTCSRTTLPSASRKVIPSGDADEQKAEIDELIERFDQAKR